MDGAWGAAAAIGEGETQFADSDSAMPGASRRPAHEPQHHEPVVAVTCALARLPCCGQPSASIVQSSLRPETTRLWIRSNARGDKSTMNKS